MEFIESTLTCYMPIGLSVVDIVLLFVLIKRIKEYELAAEAERQSKKFYDEHRDYLETAVRDWARQRKRVSIASHFSDTDLLNYRQHTARKKAVIDRITRSLGYRVMKCVEPQELIENGIVVGYKVDLEVRDYPKDNNDNKKE